VLVLVLDKKGKKKLLRMLSRAHSAHVLEIKDVDVKGRRKILKQSVS
jgi:hypothetical protein